MPDYSQIPDESCIDREIKKAGVGRYILTAVSCEPKDPNMSPMNVDFTWVVRFRPEQTGADCDFYDVQEYWSFFGKPKNDKRPSRIGWLMGKAAKVLGWKPTTGKDLQRVCDELNEGVYRMEADLIENEKEGKTYININWDTVITLPKSEKVPF